LRAATAAAFLLTACGESRDSNLTFPDSGPAVSATPLLPPEIFNAPVGSEFADYQPMLEASGFTLNSREIIIPEDGVPVSILNFTQNKINAQVIAGTIDKYSKITNNKTLNKLEYPYIQGYTHVVPLPMEVFAAPVQRILFFVPENAPFPDSTSIASGVPTSDLPAYTLIGDFGMNYSVVKVGTKFKHVEFESIEEAASIFSATELCQQKMFAAVADSQGNLNIPDPFKFPFPAELLCNSMGEAVGSAAIERPFQEYVEEITNRNIEGSPLIGLDEATYNDLPRLGSVIQ